LPSTASIGQRSVAIGAFVVAAFCHLAYDASAQRRYRLVWLAYASALAITLVGIALPGVLYSPVTFTAGPLFWPGMALALAALALPLSQLAGAYRLAAPSQRAYLRALFLSGLIGLLGSWANAVLLTHRFVVPHGIFVVLGSLLLLANAVRAHEPVKDRRLLERSLLYAALAALLSGGFLFGVMTLVSRSAEPLLTQYRYGALLLLVMAALAFEPLRQQLQEFLGRRLLRNRVPAADLARALATQEARADQAGRLAELGAFTSAVAHEIRNPLGVVAANLRMLEHGGADADTVAAIREQLNRAGRFIDDLLRYGRPRPLEPRMIDLEATIALAVSTARDGLGLPVPGDLKVEIACSSATLLEADQAQLSQALVVLIDNALLAVIEAETKVLRLVCQSEKNLVKISVEDSGPGISPELAPQLFQPFVTGRKRQGARPGTGLGLAIVRGIVERHGGRVAADRSPLGGARFVIELPRYQAVLTAAAADA
jgi:signal transduction histidine kinase